MDITAVCKAVQAIVHPVYLVGGSVRDLRLGLAAKDYDFCTPLPPDEVEACVQAAGRRVYAIGKRFGTIGFKLDGNFIEITTFRQEQYKPGSRKPVVAFVKKLDDDLSRRDFTINAMAMELKNDKLRLIDRLGGQQDIDNKLIRAVGSPLERIKEDPLRMLRAARFAAQLGFRLEPTLQATLQKKPHLILTISRERWNAELDKLLMSPYPGQGLEVLADSTVLKYLLPELWIQVGYDQDSPYHSLDLWHHTMKTLELAPPDIELRWAALLHDIGKPFVKTKNDRGYSNFIMHEKISAELAIGIAHRLKWSTARRERVCELVGKHMEADSPLRPADNGAK